MFTMFSNQEANSRQDISRKQGLAIGTAVLAGPW